MQTAGLAAKSIPLCRGATRPERPQLAAYRNSLSLVHENSITDQATAGNVGVGQRLRFRYRYSFIVIASSASPRVSHTIGFMQPLNTV
ncbi:hypothetical protein AGR2A_Lc40007 [Agrobacterium genomosp. 2 str. CFBP 5494]|uniref:Uncharacterized protein n=1 Tax=Agrobacterium genomosp. 2 str. CFBP 5494 TaxID=1183436 RepID=A0A9W5B4R2_9HYPH|nr:hypothetical protein AGR2A_Lc40007 [Agrobacterium genomosp. 2 str. CFBP 5494]